MGAANSSEPRTVTMDNPNPGGVIDVSDEVVARLKKGISKQIRDDAAAAYKDSTESKKPAGKTVAAAVPAPAKAPARQVPIVYQNTTPISTGTTTMTALDMRRQKDEELKQNDEAWRKRMAELERSLNKTNDIMEKEYTVALEDVRKRFATVAPAHQMPPCQSLKAQVVACYRTNSGETLKCAGDVAAFRNCVSASRLTKFVQEAKPADKPAAVPVSTAKAA